MTWREDALCRGRPTWLWFAAGDPVAVDVAARICRSCPVRPDCAAAALQLEEHSGVWAGIGPDRLPPEEVHRALSSIARRDGA